MGAWGELPAANPEGSQLGADDIQINRRDPAFSATDGAISGAWELVKEKPFETLFLSFLTLVFGGASGNCSNPTSFIPNDFGDTDSGTEYDYETTVEAGGTFWEGFTSGLGSGLGGISATEIGLMVGIFAVVGVLMIVGWIINSLLQGGVAIFWLRHVRGQDSYLGHSTKSVSYLLPIMFTNLMVGICVMFGVFLLLVPGVILSLGWIFVLHVMVDKNVGYVEAMKVSWRLTDGYKVDLFILMILIILLNIGGVLACCVGVIATNAIAQGAMAIVYNRLAEPGNAYLDTGEEASAVFE